MDIDATPHRRNLRIAAHTNLGLSTVRRYYSGKPITPANLATIERACVVLGLPTREDAAGTAA